MRNGKGRTGTLGAAFLLLILATGVCLAGSGDLNPNKYALTHKHSYEADVEGEGYVMVYQKVDTNNLSLDEYMHGSGTINEADLLTSEQKSSHYGTYWYYSDTSGWKEQSTGASSVISLSKQNDMTYSPEGFSYGTGWYSNHPVVYNSLIKDRTVAKSYQEAAMMMHQLEYARGFSGDITVDMNCTGPTEKSPGKGLISMKLEDDVTQGTVHVGELLSNTLYSTRKNMKAQGWKNPLIEVDANYVGSFRIKKTMSLEISKYNPTSSADWLPCCSGGFLDVPGYDKVYGDKAGIFDCTCRETALKGYAPAWNATMAQFPADEYRLKA